MLTNKRFVITTTILSRAKGATPADVTWYRGEDHAQALAALVSAAAQDVEDRGSNLPESMRFDVKAVRLDIYDLTPPEPVLAVAPCSGRMPGAMYTVPYCHKNEGGCAFHYPSEQVSGNQTGATASTEPSHLLHHAFVGEPFGDNVCEAPTSEDGRGKGGTCGWEREAHEPAIHLNPEG